MPDSKTRLRSTARKMFQHAITDSASQLGVDDSTDLVELLREGDCYRCDVVRHNLARQVGDYLATVDPYLRAVYLYDPDSACGAFEPAHRSSSASSAINLIAWSRTQKSLPAPLLLKLREALDTARQEILCSKSTALCFAVNIAVVNDAQVRSRRGYAAAITSVTARPTLVWGQPAAGPVH